MLEEQEHLSLLYRRLDALRMERIGASRPVHPAQRQHAGRPGRAGSFLRHALPLPCRPSTPRRTGCASVGSTVPTASRCTSAGWASSTTPAIIEQLLMDWRAPSSRPFYVATAANPLGVRRRRYIRTRRRQVEAVSRRVPGPDRSGDGGRRGELLGRTCRRGGVAGRRAGAAHRPDGRHRRHHPVRAGPDHPRRPGRDHGRPGRARHRQDRGRPAPGGVPALQPPRPAGAARRADHRAEPDLPRLHQPGAAVARRERRRAVHHRRPVPRGVRAGRRGARRCQGQGPHGDDDGDRQRGAAPAGDPVRVDQGPVRRCPRWVG